MQPSNSLITFGVGALGAIVAANAMAASPAAAEPKSRQPLPADQSPTADVVSAKSDLFASDPAAEPQFQLSQSPDQQRFQNRLDQLQTQTQIQQQLNQSAFKASNQPLNPGFNSLQLDQQIQQQLNLQNAQELRTNVRTSPSQTLDQLQFEQQTRQQMQQNQPKSQAAQPTRTTNTKPSVNQPTASPRTASGSATPRSAGRPPLRLADLMRSANRSRAASAQTPAQKPGSTRQVATASSSTARPSGGQSVSQSAISQSATNATTPTSGTAARATNSSPASKPTTTAQTAPRSNSGSGTAQTSPTPATTLPFSPTPSSSTPSTPSLNPVVPPSAPPSNASLTNNNPAPDYLNPDPNPLSVPTQSGEVQVAGTQPITLKQAVELAIRNNPSLQQQRLTVQGSQADLSNAQSTNLPTLSNSTSLIRQGSDTAVTSPFDGSISRQGATALNLGTGLQVNYNVFTSGRRPALIRAAQGQVRLQQLELERQTELLIFNVTSNYYSLQQASAQVNIYSAQLAQAQISLRDAQALERAGVGTRFDVLQSEVQVANAQQQLTQQLSQLNIARRTLAQQLNIAQAVDITAADPIEVAGVWELSLEESIVQGYKNRAELEQQLIQREIAQQNRKAALAQLGPQVALSGAFNVNVPEVNFDRIGYTYQFGVQVNTDLFDGGAARAQANRQESNIGIADSQFEQSRAQIRFDIEQAYSQLNASFANIQTTALAVQQATEALRLARLRFQAGVGTQTDVLTQQSALTQAQVNNLSAILDYNRALASLRRGVSNYPEGLLNGAP
jgi:OMF family outer membrane factor